MHIGIDISVLCNQWDGIGTYTLDVLKYIAKYTAQNDFYLYANQKLVVSLNLDDRFHILTDNCTNHLWWLLIKLPKYAKRDRLDVLWQPNFILPFHIKGVRNVVNVHDMSAYLYSEFASFKTNIIHKLFLGLTCKKADTILAISHDVENEIKKVFPNEKNKVKTIYIGKKMFSNGLNASEKECVKCLNEFGINKNEYLLFVGTLSPRKNAKIIIEGYISYRKNGGKKKLVLAGNISSKCNNIRKIIENSKYNSDIVIAGYVNDLQKRILYYHAAMLLFPSRLEGFGFPILEAMQAEIPIITSKCSCMPEVAGEAAIYLNDIDNVDEMSQLIFEVENLTREEKSTLIDLEKIRVQYFDEMNYRKLIYEELLGIN